LLWAWRIASTKRRTRSEPLAKMAEFDLTSKMGQYLDRHLVFPLLEFLHEHTELFLEEDLLKSKYELLQQTSMIDSSIDIFKVLNPDQEPAAELVARRDTVVANLCQLQKDSAPLVELFQSKKVQEEAQRGDGQYLRDYLEENHDFKAESLDTLYSYGRILYDIGRYGDAAVVLYQYNALSTDTEKTFSALWGRFAAGILCQEWDNALEDLNRLKEFIDTTPCEPLKQLQQRTWLIHWSLFVFFNHETGLDAIIDLFLYQPAYANTIQTVCPHILRYLTTAVIAQSQTQKRRDVLKHLVKVIQQESYTYRDPITEFVECLYVNFDFEGAQKKLRECELVLLNDFFLVARRDEFIENARLFIFETYCRIHNTISIKMLAEKLNMEADRAEEWIVNLIRHARLDAKIDSKAGTVMMTPKVPSIYHQVIEKTKHLTFRSAQLEESDQLKGKGKGGGDRGGGGFRGGGGSSGFRGGGNQGPRTCHICGEVGHLRRDCPQNGGS